jgi:pimeloyl-ACP methyl ester carboxylesterase
MPQFSSDGIAISYAVYGAGPPVLLIHGFASSGRINWVDTGWVDTLTAAGYQAITLDNRGHGESRKLYDPQLYFAHEMAEDARRLLDHLGIDRAAVLGYSMGARLAAFFALNHPDRVAAAVFGGMGLNLIAGLDDSEAIIAALQAERIETITSAVGLMFRRFAEQTGSDRAALAACMIHSREPMAEADVRRIAVPVLVAVGSADGMAGAPEPLVALLPAAEGFVIDGRDHMKGTGDRSFKARTLDFLARQPAWSRL